MLSQRIVFRKTLYTAYTAENFWLGSAILFREHSFMLVQFMNSFVQLQFAFISELLVTLCAMESLFTLNFMDQKLIYLGKNLVASLAFISYLRFIHLGPCDLKLLLLPMSCSLWWKYLSRNSRIVLSPKKAVSLEGPWPLLPYLKPFVTGLAPEWLSLLLVCRKSQFVPFLHLPDAW